MRTVGVSPKTILAGVLPALGTLVAVGIQWAVTGSFDRAELVTALTGLSASLVSVLGAYVGEPGNVVPAAPPPVTAPTPIVPPTPPQGG